MDKQKHPHHQWDQRRVMFDIVAFQRSFRLPFQRNVKITASAASDSGGDGAGGGNSAAGRDHLTVSFR